MRYLWLLIFFAVLIWSGIQPKGYFIWFLEVAPALMALTALAISYKSFKMTTLLYVLILIHCVILMIGGHYTYAEVPFMDGFLGSTRNNYDKIGHFVQGFIPAMVAREVLLRKNVVNGKGWMFFLIICFCLAVSAFYELIEWWVAAATGEAADAFLGSQGYIWDTQSDMGLALLGAIIALLSLSRYHDQQLEKL